MDKMNMSAMVHGVRKGQTSPGGGDGTHSRIPALEIPWTRCTWRLWSIGSERVRHPLEEEMAPTPGFPPGNRMDKMNMAAVGNPMDKMHMAAVVHGVGQGQTQLSI